MGRKPKGTTMTDVIHSDWFPEARERLRELIALSGTNMGYVSLALENQDVAAAWKPFRAAENEHCELGELLAKCMEAAEEWRKISTIKGYRSSKEWKRGYMRERQRMWRAEHPDLYKARVEARRKRREQQQETDKENG